MGIGIRRSLNKLYIYLVVLEFSIRKFFFGFENANKMLQSVDKRAIIPILRKNGATIGSNCDIESPLIFHNCEDYKNLIIGNNCHIGKNTFLDLKAPIVIEDAVCISMCTTILTHFDAGKSPLKKHGFPDSKSKVLLKKGCYIGANAIILLGVTIGKCAVVGAGAVVAKDVAPFTVVGGVPAKMIKKIKV